MAGMGVVDGVSIMRPMPCSLLILPLLAFGACSDHHHDHHAPVPAETPRTVSMQIEVFDPDTNLVWVGVDVRIVEAALEWSGATVTNPDPDFFLTTDDFGQVFFDAEALAAAQVGFVEDGIQRAVLEPEFDRDEAFVQIEISAPGFTTVLTDVHITWENPDVFVSIPF